MIAEKKVTDANNDFDELSNMLQYHTCSNKNYEFLKRTADVNLKEKISKARLRMGVRATCAVDRLRQDKDNLTEENERLKEKVKCLEKDIDKLEKGETAKLAEMKQYNQQLDDRNMQLSAKLYA